MCYLHDRFGGLKGEVSMFQMIDDEKAGPEDRKVLLYKIGAFIVAMAALGGVIYFFAFVSYSSR